jgi:hypothetical protein
MVIMTIINDVSFYSFRSEDSCITVGLYGHNDDNK